MNWLTNGLVVYFSRGGDNYVNGSIKRLTTGNTEVAAGILGKLTGADRFKIEPVRAYSKDYYVCIDEAKQDLRRGARPDLKRWPDTLDNRKTIFLGYPNYWGTMPVAVFSFLEHYDFTGKIIMPFCTHEGGGMGSSETDLAQTCPTAIIRQGLPILGSIVRQSCEQLEQWLSQNGYRFEP